MTNISYAQIIELLPKKVSLYYVDYSDNLSEHLDIVQAAIHGNSDELDEIFTYWDTWESVKYLLDELKNDIERKYEIDDAQDLIDEYIDDLRDEIYYRDTSTPLADLIRNTGEQVFFYDTGMSIGDYTTDIRERVSDCKRALRIPQKNKDFDSQLTDMCCNAGYGGQLVIYFYDDLERWLNLDRKKILPNAIEFSGSVTVAIVNHMNGSGGDTEIGHSFWLPFDRQNVFLDKTISYNYTYSVCGMISSWCNGTQVELTRKRTHKKAAHSPTNDHIERERQLDATFKDGKCTPGDMKYSRHRDVTYINEYPCGSKCPHCGTFWID